MKLRGFTVMMGFFVAFAMNAIVNIYLSQPNEKKLNKVVSQVFQLETKLKGARDFEQLFDVKNQQAYRDSLCVWQHDLDSLKGEKVTYSKIHTKYFEQAFIYGYFTD